MESYEFIKIYDQRAKPRDLMRLPKERGARGHHCHLPRRARGAAGALQVRGHGERPQGEAPRGSQRPPGPFLPAGQDGRPLDWDGRGEATGSNINSTGGLGGQGLN